MIKDKVVKFLEDRNFKKDIVKKTGCTMEVAEKLYEEVKTWNEDFVRVFVENLDMMDLKGQSIDSIVFGMEPDHRLCYHINLIKKNNIGNVISNTTYCIYPSLHVDEIFTEEYIKDRTKCTEEDAKLIYEKFSNQTEKIKQLFIDNIDRINLEFHGNITVSTDNENISIIAIHYLDMVKRFQFNLKTNTFEIKSYRLCVVDSGEILSKV